MLDLRKVLINTGSANPIIILEVANFKTKRLLMYIQNPMSFCFNRSINGRFTAPRKLDPHSVYISPKNLMKQTTH